MQMKIFLKTLALVSVCALAACSDLDRFPLEELSDASFWKTVGDAESAVSELYNYLPETSEMMDEEINSDNAIHGIKWAAGNIAYGIYDPADFSWSRNYEAIRIANLVLKKAPEIEGVKSEDIKSILGEAYFFRAYQYWTLIRNYGNVPYVDHPLELSEQGDIHQSDTKSILASVYADYDKAAESLPEVWDGADYGRVTKGAALGMKSRAALYYKDWETALESARVVKDMGIYDLYRGDYADLFREAGDHCNERILVRNFSEGIGSGNQYHIGFESFPTIGWGGIDPTQSLVDAFECIDGKPIGESPLYDPLSPFENRDPRLEVAVLHDGETYTYRTVSGALSSITISVAPLASNYPQGIGTHGDATATGYYQQKWLDPTKDPQDNNQGWDCGMDATIMRYAEILLTIAEAANEIAGAPTAEAYEAVNEVRARVGMPAVPAGLSKEQFRERVRNEWRVEMCLEEGLRQWDLRRWGIAKDVYNDLSNWYGIRLTQNADGSYTLYKGEPYCYYDAAPGYNDHNYIYPVPQEELDLNTNLKQNPGY